jgi:hypothetical protein
VRNISRWRYLQSQFGCKGYGGTSDLNLKLTLNHHGVFAGISRAALFSAAFFRFCVSLSVSPQGQQMGIGSRVLSAPVELLTPCVSRSRCWR